MRSKQKKHQSSARFSRLSLKNNSGFTLLELLVVIAIIGILAGIVLFSIASARVKGRDAKRSGDIREVIDALEQYHVQNGSYPTGTVSTQPAGGILTDPGAFDGGGEAVIPNYLPLLPTSPKPADGSCAGSGQGSNDYWYQVDPLGISYTITFCLGADTSSWPAGVRTATPDGVQ